jgi:hypothetical protein
MIEELLEECLAPRNLLVVSSDHRVQRAARHCGASFVDSEEWYRNVLARNRDRAAAGDDGATKPDEQLTPEELNYWIRQFGDGTGQERGNDDPFPPGDGDDIEEE